MKSIMIGLIVAAGLALAGGQAQARDSVRVIVDLGHVGDYRYYRPPPRYTVVYRPAYRYGQRYDYRSVHRPVHRHHGGRYDHRGRR